jgi:hypothetical protein
LLVSKQRSSHNKGSEQAPRLAVLFRSPEGFLNKDFCFVSRENFSMLGNDAEKGISLETFLYVTGDLEGVTRAMQEVEM